MEQAQPQMEYRINKSPAKLSRRALKRKLWAYAFIAPQVVLMVVFTLYPIVMSYVYSFFDWSGLGPLNKFVGFDNYYRLITERLFWNAFKNTFVFMLGVVLIQVPAALILAIILNNPKLRFTTFYRTVYFLPVVTITVVVGAVMFQLFKSHDGFVNELLMMLGIVDAPVNWLGRGDLAMWVLIFVSTWKWFGIKMIYWLAGLQSIPYELYEAARIDGAGRGQSFVFITVPLIMPIGLVILLISIVDALYSFDLVKAMTNGGPGFSTELVDLYIFRYAFGGDTGVGIPQLGYASSAGVFFGITVFLISITLGWCVRAAYRGRDGK